MAPAPSYCELYCLNPGTAGSCRGRRCAVRASIRGEASALDLLFENLAPTVRRLAAQLCHHPEDAEDLTQETLLLALTGLPALRHPHRVLSWVKTIARHRHLERHRLPAHTPRHFEELLESILPASTDPSADPDGRLFCLNRARRLSEAAETLPPSLHAAYQARVLEGLSTRATALRLQTTEAAIRTRLRRARLLLRSVL